MKHPVSNTEGRLLRSDPWYPLLRPEMRLLVKPHIVRLTSHQERGIKKRQRKKIGQTLRQTLPASDSPWRHAGLVKHTLQSWRLIRHWGLICPHNCPQAGGESRSLRESKSHRVGDVVAPKLPLERKKKKSTLNLHFTRTPPIKALQTGTINPLARSLPLRPSLQLNVSMVRDLRSIFCLSALDKSFQNPALPSDAWGRIGGAPHDAEQRFPGPSIKGTELSADKRGFSAGRPSLRQPGV